jgi:tubulin monoglycylase TTLL15
MGKVIPLALAIFGITLTVVFNNDSKNSTEIPVEVLLPKVQSKIISPLKFWFYTKSSTFMLQTIESILLKMGFEMINMDTSSDDTFHYDWDLAWTYDHFVLIDALNYSALKPHQKFNHFPGNYYLTSKSELSTNTESKFIPRGFTDLKSLRNYEEKNPGTRFVQKLKGNHGVSLKKAEEIDFDSTGDFQTDSFAQVFVEDPLLIDGHKFEFNIFVAITSVNPLRVYYYQKDILLRFAGKPYNPNDFTELQSYLIEEHFIIEADFPAIKKYYERNYSFKEAFDANLREIGHDPKTIYDQVEECISEVILKNEQKIVNEIKSLNATNGKNHFFELVRFDFLIDAKLKIHLMEINQNPTLYADHKLRHNHQMHVGVIYNLMNLISVGNSLEHNEISENNIYSFLNGLTVRANVCITSPCDNNCDGSCNLCMQCLSEQFKNDLKFAYLEHIKKGEFKRVFPRKSVS